MMKEPSVVGPSTCLRIMHVFNIIVALTIMNFGVLGIIYVVPELTEHRAYLIVSPCFVVIIGFIMLLSECRADFFKRHFGFLRNLLVRSIINILLSSTIFYYFIWQDNKVLSWVTSMILLSVGVIYLFLGCFFRDVAEDLSQPLLS